jgi:2-keto-4-pentenoate hydratase/2-oxohepta-3-ene-1,7-dioic acid hydratase in catechol pathway
MRIVNIEKNGRPTLAVRTKGGLVEVGGELKAVLEAGGLAHLKAQAEKGKVEDDKGVKFLPVVHNPNKVLCLGLNYRDHAIETKSPIPEYPVVFTRAQTTLVGHGQPMVRPNASEQLDFEAELAVIIGKRGRNVAKADALKHVAGYSCFNDGSVRDYQRKASQWTIGKNFDGTGPIGPWLVPASELPPGCTGLKIESRLNGQVMQSDNTSNMIVSVKYALQLISEAMTLEPGDVIMMGTPSGVGYARTPPVFMKAGDTIEIEIEKLGVLSNRIVDEAA